MFITHLTHAFCHFCLLRQVSSEVPKRNKFFISPKSGSTKRKIKLSVDRELEGADLIAIR
jgi:hypothetical protein